MPLDLRHVHKFATVVGQSQPQLVDEHHYVRLKGEGADYPLYIQNGQVWAELGPAIPEDEWPDWLHAEIRKCSPMALAVAGWTGPMNYQEPTKARR